MNAQFSIKLSVFFYAKESNDYTSPNSNYLIEKYMSSFLCVLFKGEAVKGVFLCKTYDM